MTEVNGIDYILINENRIDGYSDYFILNEVIYATEPNRALDFSMPDINSIERKEVPHLFIEYKYLPIDKYKFLLDCVKDAEFVITYYDYTKENEHKTVSGKFYMKPLARSTLYSKFSKELSGAIPKAVTGLTIEFVATLND